MPGATPACCKWERAPGCVLLADIHGSRSDRVRARASVCVCVCAYYLYSTGSRGGG